MMTLRDLSRRTAFRIAVIFAALFLFTVAAIFAVLYQRISDEIATKLKSDILESRDTLVEVNNQNGLQALADVIKNKRPPTPDDEAVYILTDKSGTFLAGNVEAIPRFEGWREIEWETLRFKNPADAYEGTDLVVAMWTPLRDGFLLVGEGNNEVEETQALLMKGLWWGVVMSLTSALAGGIVLGQSAQRRIDKLEVALTDVSRGNLAARIHLTSSGDDLDHVAQRINATLDHLQAAVMTLSQVSTDIAHDLKTPIGRISQQIDTARRSATTVADYREAMDDVHDELDGVVATFEALLRIAQIEGGARKARFGPVDLRDILNRVVEAYVYVGEDRNHSISANLGGEIDAGAWGDRDLLVQLFANLIENSLRHCPPGSETKVSLESSEGLVTVCVADNGPGIPEREHDRVFRRLYRLEKSRTTPGSGLGLSLVAAIAALHDAKVKLGDNHPGLIVTVQFPNPRRNSQLE